MMKNAEGVTIMAKRNRFQQMEQLMTRVLLVDLALFVLYLLFAAVGITWLKVILSICVVLISAACLAFLYLTQELLKRRSLWMTSAAGAILVCLIFSLILQFP